MGLNAEPNNKTINTGAQKGTEDTQGRRKGQMEQQGADRKTRQNLALWVNKKHREKPRDLGSRGREAEHTQQ